MVDLTPYTTIAADTIRAKAALDAARLTGAEWVAATIWDGLDADMKERMFGLLAER